MDVTTFQATCSVCSEEYTAWRKRLPGYCTPACQQRDGRRKRIKLEIWKEYHGIDSRTLIDPETGETVLATTVNFTPRGWELVGRYCAKYGQTAEEFVAEELREAHNELLRPHGLEMVGDTRIVYPEEVQRLGDEQN